MKPITSTNADIQSGVFVPTVESTSDNRYNGDGNESHLELESGGHSKYSSIDVVRVQRGNVAQSSSAALRVLLTPEVDRSASGASSSPVKRFTESQVGCERQERRSEGRGANEDISSVLGAGRIVPSSQLEFDPSISARGATCEIFEGPKTNHRPADATRNGNHGYTYQEAPGADASIHTSQGHACTISQKQSFLPDEGHACDAEVDAFGDVEIFRMYMRCREALDMREVDGESAGMLSGVRRRSRSIMVWETKERDVLGKFNWRSVAEEFTVALVAEIFEQDHDLGNKKREEATDSRKGGELDVVIEWDGQALVKREVLQSATQSRPQKRVAGVETRDGVYVQRPPSAGGEPATTRGECLVISRGRKMGLDGMNQIWNRSGYSFSRSIVEAEHPTTIRKSPTVMWNR
ncbi:hypothetical protein C8R44DRAFT_752383 [Mycena epipterygia]|nr:hypothetical protein C8R44DRAFT_752383 [Mycena epipterygia]